jgi:hypothetical protein
MPRKLPKAPARLRYAKERDRKRERLQRSLRQHRWFDQVPSQVLGGLAELILISRELRARIQHEGVMRPRPDGISEIHPAVEPLRRYKLAELDYLRTINEIRLGEEGVVIDLPAAVVGSSDEADGAE